MNRKTWFTVWFYSNGELYGFNKFYTLKAAKAFIKLTTLDRAKIPNCTYKIEKRTEN